MTYHLVNALCDPPKLGIWTPKVEIWSLICIYFLSFLSSIRVVNSQSLHSPYFPIFWHKTQKNSGVVPAWKFNLRIVGLSLLLLQWRDFSSHIFIMGLASMSKWLMRKYVGESGLKCPWLLTWVIWKFQAHWNAPLRKKNWLTVCTNRSCHCNNILCRLFPWRFVRTRSSRLTDSPIYGDHKHKTAT